MTQLHLFTKLDSVAERYRQLRLLQGLAIVWLFATLVAGAVWVWKTHASWSGTVLLTLLLIGAAVLAGCAAWLAMISRRSRLWIAARIESIFPELRTSLLAAVEQKPELADGRFGYLQSIVIEQVVHHSYRHPWTDVVPTRSLALARTANIAGFTLFVAVLCGVMFFARAPQTQAASDLTGKRSNAAGAKFSLTVEPGNTEVEQGTSLLVLARILGEMPAQATLLYGAAGKESVRLPMTASLNDLVFGGRISRVDEPLEYQIELPGHKTEVFYVTTFEYPRLERADAHLVYPSYTGMAERLIQDVRTITCVEGTQVTLQCTLNKPVVSAVLKDLNPSAVNEAPLVLAASTEKPTLYEVTIECTETKRLELQLTDDAGRKNTKPPTFTLSVQPNRPPELKAVLPARDLEVSPIEELATKSSVWDDFGVQQSGLTYSLAGGEPVDVLLGTNLTAKQAVETPHVIALESLNAEPDQLLTYFWWAEDIGPDGQVRRVESDMYFAEVRPFEEIFREGEQPPGGEQQQAGQQGQSPAGQAAQQLAQLQKDIINATWKLIRRETRAELSKEFAEDSAQVHLSQSSALEQAVTLAEELQDERSKEHVQTVIAAMTTAVEKLQLAASSPAKEPLRDALKSEQTAYEALLRLRSREHEIVQQQRQQGSSQPNAGRSQQQRQQLEQLEMANEENRYETQRTAQEQQVESPEQRENRQVLNRLRELARRQEDMNERLKELQAALEQAPTEREKEEIRKQLKRLQEEQQQILQDTDELQSRMEQPENAQSMSEQREQLSETREQVRRTSEALEQGMTSQAAAAGSRAQEQFENLREEFRRRASQQFEQELQQMRSAAQELDEKQKALSETLKKEQPEERSLSATNPIEEATEEVRKQRARLEELQNTMRQTIEQAEQTEPLLSERLYDAVRNVQDHKLEQVLEATEQSLEQGFKQDAVQLEGIASEGVRQLREGIEKAAEGVLGDDTEALRRAREELRNLARELREEVARNAPELAQADEHDSEAPAGERTAESGAGSARSPVTGEAADERDEPNAARNRGSREGEDGVTERPVGDGTRNAGERANPSGQGGETQENGGQRSASQRNGRPQGQSGSQDEANGGRGEIGDQSEAGEGEQQRPNEDQQSAPGEESAQGYGKSPSEASEQGTDRAEGSQPGSGENQSQPANSDADLEQQSDGQRSGTPAAGSASERGENSQSGEPSTQDREGGPQRSLGTSSSRGGPERLESRGARSLSGAAASGSEEGFGTSGTREAAPIAGEDFREWSDRLRDVEEMVEDPEIRAEAARIREEARSTRLELKRHSKVPNWELVQMELVEPLVELEQRVADEVLRRASKKALVPLDRDPVPPEYSEMTRKYYERLGSGR